MIEIEFVGSGNIWGRIIKWGTMSDIDHVQFVLPDGRRLGAIPGPGVSYAAAPDASCTVRRYRLDAPGTVLAFAQAQYGKPYDFGAVLAIATRITLNRDWRKASRWFCSELVAAACEAAGYPLLDASDLAVITPRDLELSPLLTSITA